MIKVFSDITKQYYNSVKEAEEAEKKFNAEKEAKEKAKNVAIEKVAAIKKQRDAEVKACNDEIDATTLKIEELIKKRDSLRADRQHINDEAAHEIAKYTYDGTVITDTDQPECVVKVKTFDSTKDKDWTTVIDEHGSVDEVLKKLKRFNESDLKHLLSVFNI